MKQTKFSDYILIAVLAAFFQYHLYHVRMMMMKIQQPKFPER